MKLEEVVGRLTDETGTALYIINTHRHIEKLTGDKLPRETFESSVKDVLGTLDYILVEPIKGMPNQNLP